MTCETHTHLLLIELQAGRSHYFEPDSYLATTSAQYQMLRVLWWGISSCPAPSRSFIKSYRKKSIRIALISDSGYFFRISRRINSTHQMLQPARRHHQHVPAQQFLDSFARQTHTSDLNLPSVAAFNHLLLCYGMVQERTIAQATQRIQDLGHAVIGKHGDLVDVTELAEAFSFEGGPEVGNAYLGALEEAHALAVPEADDVVEAGEVCC